MYPLALPVALSFWLFSLLSPILALSTSPSPRGGHKSSDFVSVSGTGFSVNNKKFTFVGTNAYWLPYLNTDDDVRDTLANMSKSGISVVRTWAFNDVTKVPDSGSFLLLIKDGKLTLNEGANGVQRIDKLVKFAKEFNIFVTFTLTNNWFPTVNAPPAAKATALPRNFLSNNYGGMDLYVQQFGDKMKHDEFYTNKKVRKAFDTYVSLIVNRYANEPSIVAWELANDARCSSTLPASADCNTNTVTRWHAETASLIRSIDPNHLITPGDHGFSCPTCPKLFPLAKSEHNKGARRRIVDGFVTRLKLGKRIVESSVRGGTTIRGLWKAPHEARMQGSGSLSVFNGAFGVDTEDILNAPDIDFGTFQLFPDQVNYAAQGTANNVQPPSSTFNTTLTDTTIWINTHSQTALTFSKPVVLNAFSIVTQDNLPFFVPFNETSPVVTTPPNNRKRQTAAGTFGTGVTAAQIDNTYSTWLQAGLPGLGGMNQYQWSSPQVTVGDGVVPNPAPAAPGGPIPTFGPTPNDGMAILGPDESDIPGILGSTAAILGSTS